MLPFSSLAFEKELSEAWSSAKQVVFKDLPRLAKRMTVWSKANGLMVDCGKKIELTSKSNNKNNNTKSSNDNAVDIKNNNNNGINDDNSDDDLSVWNSICDVIMAVASVLEKPEAVQVIQNSLTVLGREVALQSDLSVLVEELFVTKVGLQSRTFSVFRCAHQSILFPAVLHLQTNVYNNDVGMLKDVRRDEGWQVVFSFGDSITITHIRIEQSMGDPHSPKHFECQWDLRLNFDCQMAQLRNALVRMESVIFHNDANPDWKSKIQKRLLPLPSLKTLE